MSDLPDERPGQGSGPINPNSATGQMIQVIYLAAKELNALTAQRKIEFEWEKEERNKPLATKQDLEAMEQRLSVLIKAGSSSPKRIRFDWAVGPVTNKTSNQESTPMDLKLTNEQKATVTLKPVTDAGKPATLDGKPRWSIITGDSTITVADDGMSASIRSSDTPGDSQVLVEGDADLGEGVEPISDVIKVTVVGASAKNLGLVASAPEPKDEITPPPPPPSERRR